MSRSLNKVTLIGNLGADPEVRSTSGGGRVATLRLATSRQWNGQGGREAGEDRVASRHRLEQQLWRRDQLADIAEKYCKKGDKVYVEGSIEYRSWQDKEGQTRYTTEISANELILLSGKGGSGAEAGFAPARAAMTPATAAKKEAKEDGRSPSMTSPKRWTARRRPSVLTPGS